MRVTGYVARLAVVAAVLVAVAPAHANQRDPWDGPPVERPSRDAPSDHRGRPDPPFPPERVAGDPARATQIEQARRQVLDDAYQTELPDGLGTGSGGAAGRPGRTAGGELVDREHRRRVDARTRDEAGPMSSVVNVVMWVMVIVVSGLGALWLASELSKYGGDAELPLEDEPHARMAAAAGAIIERPLEDADELARRGAFAAAIHTLLLRTLHELARTAAVRVAPATTSREILARVPLLADARSALAGLITAVEITHFGDEPASAEDYERCRRQFHVFAAAFRHGAPPPPQVVAA